MRKKESIKGIRLILFPCISVLCMMSCQRPEYNEMSGRIFGTYYHIKYEEGSDATTKRVTQEGLDSVFSAVNQSLSTFIPTSVISRINQNDTTVDPDSLFMTVFQCGERVSQETEGAFDMTVAPLVNLWGFGFQKSDSVTPRMVDSLRASVGYSKVRLENRDGRRKIRKENSGTMIDASAIAKGFGCDCVAGYLRTCRVKNFMVEIGGEIVSDGVNPDGKEWCIGITQPTEDNSVERPKFTEIVRVSGRGMATSGNYRQFYYKDGKRFSHTVDPKSGYPVDHSLLSTTVIMSTCMEADAYATAFMVMGLDTAYAFAERHGEMAAYFIYANDENVLSVKYTPSFQKYLEKNP